jgi:hypothetical protein
MRGQAGDDQRRTDGGHDQCQHVQTIGTRLAAENQSDDGGRGDRADVATRLQDARGRADLLWGR